MRFMDTTLAEAHFRVKISKFGGHSGSFFLLRPGTAGGVRGRQGEFSIKMNGGGACSRRRWEVAAQGSGGRLQGGGDGENVFFPPSKTIHRLT